MEYLPRDDETRNQYFCALSLPIMEASIDTRQGVSFMIKRAIDIPLQ